jgi:hypothetical protein
VNVRRRGMVIPVVAGHFADALTTDPDVTAHAIRGARDFGWERFLTWGRRSCSSSRSRAPGATRPHG